MGMDMMFCFELTKREINSKHSKHFTIDEKLPTLNNSFSLVCLNRPKRTFISAHLQHSNFMEFNLKKTLKSNFIEIFHFAESDDFVSNLVTYARYFISVMVGTTYMMIKPITNLLNDRNTVLLAICGLMGAAYFVYFTLYSML